MIEYDKAKRLLEALEDSTDRGRVLRRRAMVLLDSLPGYDWSGIYRLEGRTLVLDEYVGAPTDHNEIPIGLGVCGTAIAENRNQIVGDVRKLDNYLACSLETRSELVVLIKDQAYQTIGQIDIDGHFTDAFDKSDEAMLEKMARILANRWDD